MSLLAFNTAPNNNTGGSRTAIIIENYSPDKKVNNDDDDVDHPVFLSRTLFRVLAFTSTNAHTNIKETTDTIKSRYASSHPTSSSSLMTFPLDGNHLFISCGSNSNTSNSNSNSDGVSSVFVVRLSTQGDPIAIRSTLALAMITGCVQDRSIHKYGREERIISPLLTREENGNSIVIQEKASAYTVGEDNANEECGGNRLLSPSLSTLNSSSVVDSSKKFILGNEPTAAAAENENEDESVVEKNEKYTGVKVILSSQTNQISSQSIHLFLMADAAMHAIWAVEVDTVALAARVVSPHYYWSLWNKCHHTTEMKLPQSSQPQVWNQEKDEKNEKECVNSILRSKPLLGGIEGFIDGPFHAARFASPSALCWRIDDNDINDDNSSGQKEGKNDISLSTVLFVSDTGNHAIRYVNFRTKLVRTVCGINGVPGYRDGDYRVSQLHCAAALTWCSSGLLFVDATNNAIRLLTGFDKAKRETLPQENVSNKTSVKELKEMRKSQRPTPRVWTVIDGLHRHHNSNDNNKKEKENKKNSKSSLFSNSKEVCRTSLNVLPHAMAIMPDGSGVLFADSSQDALCLLSTRGVKTFIGPCDYSSSSLMPDGLIACSHILACSLISPDTTTTTPRTAFLVSSGVRQAVSLLLSCSNAKSKEEAFHLAHNNNDMTLPLFPVNTVKLKDGVLHKYTHGNTKKKTKMMKKKTDHDRAVCENTADHKKRSKTATATVVVDTSTNGVKTVPVFGNETPLYSPTQNSPPLPVSTVVTTPSITISSRLRKTIQRLFDVYAYYASKDNRSNRSMRKLLMKDSNWLNNIDASYSLSLVGFWRFFTHAEYFTICTPLLSSPCGEPEVDSTFTVSEDGDRVRWGMQDWRTVVDVLHQSSVRQHGYHVVSTMNFTFFCRVILFLYSSLQRKKEEEKRREEKNKEVLGEVHTLPFFLIDGLSEDEMIDAYEDAVRRVEAVHINFSSTNVPSTINSPSKKEKQQKEIQNEKQLPRVGFLAADEVLQVLLRNERPLRQLFHAYSKKTVIHDRDCCNSSSHSSLSNPTREKRITALRQLRQVLNTGKDGKSNKKMEWISVVPYNRFHALFRAVNVFPALISESLLRRAYVDALAVPLFYRLNREKNTTMQEEENASPFSFPISHDVEKKYSRCGTALPFIPFLEAFTRVALTTFSLCGSRDRQMYPTAVAKVEALMSWINRSFELGHIHEYSVTSNSGSLCGNIRGGGNDQHKNDRAVGEDSKGLNATYRYQSSVPFPMDFISFNVTPSSAKHH
ncbi:hypothetical protein LSM04_000599 [Trypanosoma melophagium]|uniref:uncharacterized protein n=1 Tax=Trypanosoma melophagium TaxID=715481 RepID=UPI00351AA7B5|nr:hypothetical protein LSM04_000599 [Trypanosoma melophagium]